MDVGLPEGWTCRAVIFYALSRIKKIQYKCEIRDYLDVRPTDNKEAIFTPFLSIEAFSISKSPMYY